MEFRQSPSNFGTPYWKCVWRKSMRWCERRHTTRVHSGSGPDCRAGFTHCRAYVSLYFVYFLTGGDGRKGPLSRTLLELRCWFTFLWCTHPFLATAVGKHYLHALGRFPHSRISALPDFTLSQRKICQVSKIFENRNTFPGQKTLFENQFNKLKLYLSFFCREPLEMWP